MESSPSHGNLYKAATTSFDFENPGETINGLLNLAGKLTGSDHIALYEYDEGETSFIPRFAVGVPMANLGRLSSATDDPILRTVLTNHRATGTDESYKALIDSMNNTELDIYLPKFTITTPVYNLNDYLSELFKHQLI